MTHFRSALLLSLPLLTLPNSRTIAQTFNDVVYATAPADAGGTITLRMNIYHPTTGSPPYPCVIWIHGGGWQSGSYQNTPPFAAGLLPRGVAVASVQYRLSGQAIFPAQIHDVKGAVRFLRANAATYGLDPQRFGSIGTSAGGHLSALLGTSAGVAALEGTTGGNLGQPSNVIAVVDFFGPTDIININLDVTNPPGSTINHDAPTSPESRLVGWDDAGQGIGNIRANLGNPNAPYPHLVALCNQVNPITWISADDPPFFIGHGTADTTVPLNQSTRLANALNAAGLSVDYRQAPGFGHGFLGTTINDAAIDFLVQHLMDDSLLNGDLNCDGAVTVSDISPFVLALTNPTQYQQLFPNCDITAADINGDNQVTVSDIAGLVALLTQ